ncbi:MAG: hypothetical protein JO305_06500 [Alphaproteobacteria bacterium]|nr:hypothetical protein [Alphaproteobacteria bacterium]
MLTQAMRAVIGLWLALLGGEPALAGCRQFGTEPPLPQDCPKATGVAAAVDPAAMRPASGVTTAADDLHVSAVMPTNPNPPLGDASADTANTSFVAQALDWVTIHAPAGYSPSTPWIVTAPDGSEVATAGTQTNGAQEAIDYAAAHGNSVRCAPSWTGSQVLYLYKGAWTPDTSYTPNMVVQDSASGRFYYTLDSFTSATSLSADLAARHLAVLAYGGSTGVPVPTSWTTAVNGVHVFWKNLGLVLNAPLRLPPFENGGVDFSLCALDYTQTTGDAVLLNSGYQSFAHFGFLSSLGDSCVHVQPSQSWGFVDGLITAQAGYWHNRLTLDNCADLKAGGKGLWLDASLAGVNTNDIDIGEIYADNPLIATASASYSAAENRIRYVRLDGPAVSAGNVGLSWGTDAANGTNVARNIAYGGVIAPAFADSAFVQDWGLRNRVFGTFDNGQVPGAAPVATGIRFGSSARQDRYDLTELDAAVKVADGSNGTSLVCVQDAPQICYGNQVFVGRAGFVEPPATGWAADFSNSAMTVANGASVGLAPGSGLIVVTDGSVTGQTALYTLGGGSVALNSAPNAFVSPTPAPRAGHASIYWNGGSYMLVNNLGAAATFSLAMIRASAKN